MTLGYLQRNQNPNSSVRADGRRYWGYPSRNKAVQVIAIHTAETAPTTKSAEAIANYFTHSDRAASYHEVGDNDSWVTCLPPEATAFGAVGWNSNAWHWSFATRASLWGDNPAWDDAALKIGAARCRLAAQRFGIPVRRITLAQAEQGVKGFIDHARLDPARRSDPGGAFPWDRFLALTNDAEDDVMNEKQAANIDARFKGIEQTLEVVMRELTDREGNTLNRKVRATNDAMGRLMRSELGALKRLIGEASKGDTGAAADAEAIIDALAERLGR